MNAKSVQRSKRAEKSARCGRPRGPVVLLVASGEVWLNVLDIRALSGWTARHIRRTAVAESWDTRDSEFRGRNGIVTREYALSSLPSRFILSWFSAFQKCREAEAATD
jgi:hypothetical protein